MTQELRRLAKACPMEYDPMGKSGKENLQRCLSYNAFHAAANPTAILSLLDRLEKAEKDAARLDWLESKTYPSVQISAHHKGFVGYCFRYENKSIGFEGTLRDALDKVMEASK